MGARTDEVNAVKAELGATLEELDEAQDELRQGAWQRKAKAIAIVIAALATAVTAVLAYVKPETRAAATAGATAVQVRQLHSAMAQQREALEGVQERCQRSGKQAVRQAKAEADSVRTLLLGYLLAQGRTGQVQGKLGEALGTVVKQLGANQAVSDKPDPADRPQRQIKLSPPKRLESLSKGAQ